MRIQIINGPNLNLLGVREPEIYGKRAWEDYLKELRARFPKVRIDYFQSNLEGEIINKIHDTPSSLYQGATFDVSGRNITRGSSRFFIRQGKKYVDRGSH